MNKLATGILVSRQKQQGGGSSSSSSFILESCPCIGCPFNYNGECTDLDYSIPCPHIKAWVLRSDDIEENKVQIIRDQSATAKVRHRKTYSSRSILTPHVYTKSRNHKKKKGRA
jgi:hypothetical protein